MVICYGFYRNNDPLLRKKHYCSKYNSKYAYFVVLIVVGFFFVCFFASAVTGSYVSTLCFTWHWPLKENGAEERNMATSNNPRKFSEKIALHNQKQAEETAAFEEVMKDLSITRAARVTTLVFASLSFSPPTSSPFVFSELSNMHAAGAE